MAKKKTEAPRLTDTFTEFKDNKNIDRTTLVGVLEESFRNVIAREYGTDENFDVIVNPDKGDFEIYRTREVVEDGEVTDPNKQIALSEARQIEEDYEVGEDVSEKIDVSKFGRRSILTLRQTLASKVMELEYENLYQHYKEREGEMVTAEVYQAWKNETLLMDDEGNELILPKQQQIPRDFFHKGDTVRVVIDHVDNPNGRPKIYVSRTCESFLHKLLEQEIPEIADNLITVRAIARIPGERAKIAVESYDDRIDPVGACVGVKGSRIHTIVREMHNENIDVIQYSANPKIFIQRALQPAQISSIELDDVNMKAAVYLRPTEVSLAIGKNGINIKLASKLTGYSIDVYREIVDESEEDDIYLDEFADEIDQWVIDAIKGIGLKTARSVLKTPREALIEQADLEEDTVDEVIRVLKAEFDEE
ncbi:MAG: transcription termination/antitermination protein NusA [Bacteroidaceae bacterium]|nr:transcription termination/antitermination protein NusA [Bacteroidaceae bacterium]